jgi:hypothetical protein
MAVKAQQAGGKDAGQFALACFWRGGNEMVEIVHGGSGFGTAHRDLRQATSRLSGGMESLYLLTTRNGREVSQENDTYRRQGVGR